MAEVEIVARVERRRKWSEAEKAALLAEVEAEGGRVSVVARRHRVAESLLYSWRAACKAAASAAAEGEAGSLAFVPVGVVGRAADGSPTLLSAPQASAPVQRGRQVAQERVGMIELDVNRRSKGTPDRRPIGTPLRVSSRPGHSPVAVLAGFEDVAVVGEAIE